MKPWWRVHSTSSMGLKGVLDWIFNRIIPRGIIQKETSREFILGKFYLNLICGGVLKTHLTHHREKHVFRDLRLASLWHFQSEKHFWVWTSLQLSGCWVGNPISHSLTPLGSSKSMWVLPLLKLRSRYETDWMMVISCEGDFSLVLLEMFNHPYPTLVVTLNPTVTRSFREWLSYPFPCTNPEVIWKPISLRLSRTISIDLSKSFGVSVLFRQPHPLKVPNMRIK